MLRSFRANCAYTHARHSTHSCARNRYKTADLDDHPIHSPQVTVTAVPETVAPVEEDYVLVNGAPTASFKDNLRADVKYILSFPGSGFTNDVMLYVRVITPSISLLSGPQSPEDESNLSVYNNERVPVIPYFVPTHEPILEWGDIKVSNDPSHVVLVVNPQAQDLGSTKIDTLGCWNVWEAVLAGKQTTLDPSPERMKLGMNLVIGLWNSFEYFFRHLVYNGTRIDQAVPWQSPEYRYAIRFSHVARVSRQRNEHLTTPVRSPLLHASLPPDEQLLCFDNLYWATNLEVILTKWNTITALLGDSSGGIFTGTLALKPSQPDMSGGH
ncbi:unnamed protein product [Mycena citricolor]|uniref:Uncharacterized protein n=1 Tax=Mycena citricolor TaxID=2018698 RepID=A0AAD2K0F9_9AGAR|nr:unnamed protein product [Mycena citricolor]